jgi:hypothetical protein
MFHVEHFPGRNGWGVGRVGMARPEMRGSEAGSLRKPLTDWLEPCGRTHRPFRRTEPRRNAVIWMTPDPGGRVSPRWAAHVTVSLPHPPTFRQKVRNLRLASSELAAWVVMVSVAGFNPASRVPLRRLVVMTAGISGFRALDVLDVLCVRLGMLVR